MKTIKARVNKRLLAKADRLFTGTLGGRVIEVLQNARRAGAKRVEITNVDGWVTVKDNGRGVDDFAKLLDLGGSGWDERTQRSEDPAGVGLFCLSPRELTIRSRDKAVRIGADGWRGKPVAIEEDNTVVEGTELRFRDDPWDLATVEPNAVFSGLTVTVDGKECESLPFVGGLATGHPELGCRIEVCDRSRISNWHSTLRERSGYDNVLVNFHGQVVTFEYRPTSDRSLFLLVEMMGEPTGIRLMLPARTRLVENEASQVLKRVLEIEAYRHFQRVGEHTLHHSEYLRARELGIDLPEAKPVYEVGLIESCDPPEPVQVQKPDALPLASCYKLNPALIGQDDKSDANAHLLAALGSFETPFVPVRISTEYDGYGWAKLPTIERVEVQLGKKLHESFVWSGMLICVETITITAYTSDGKVFSSPVCMAALPPESGHAAWMNADRVYVTPKAQKQLGTGEIWFHLGGWYEDGDTYDTQEVGVQKDLAVFWADLVGPDESWRLQLMDATGGARDDWRTVTVSRGGSVSLVLADGSTKTIQPPAEVPPTAAA
jgi:hypothetical protein